MIGNNVKVINHSMGNGDVAFFAAQDNSVYPEAHKAINAQKASADEYEKLLSKLIDKGYDFLIVTSAGNSNNDEYYLDSTADYGFVKVSDYNKDPTKYPSADTSQTYGTSHSGASVVLNDTNAKYDDAFQYISSYKVKSHIISVGSLSQSGRISDFSCRGARVDILAPGENIRSTVTTGRGIAGGNYCDKNGTSMAAPHVSGALGLAYSVFPSIKASTLKGILTSKASDYGLIESVVSDSGATINKNYKVLNVDTLTSETLDKLSKLTTSGSTYPSQFNGIAVGFVLDENGAPLPDVNITATLESSDGLFNNNPIPIGSTSEDGSFEIILPAGRYCLEFEKLLYLGTLVYYEAIPEETAYLGEITLFNESWTDSIFQTVYGQVSDAMNGNAIAGATVKFRGGWNNTTGSYESNLLGDKVATTDSTGNYSMALQVGAYTAEISKDGYITSYVNVISSPNAIIHFSTITPILDEDEYRIILTWGDSPRDLDSHLIGSVDGNSYEVYYGSKTFSYNGEIIASLDHDDTTSYGPETITLTWKENSGNCSYYVYDYTNGGNSNSMALTYSSAKVVVYKGNSLIKSYNVPIGYNGTRWNVFTISNGVLTTVNTIS
ncbi:MAG: S8 family serine peptidase [Ruminococcus sp.]|nr:S8 family serine peptidase [Ruminococcus sp.]